MPFFLYGLVAIGGYWLIGSLSSFGQGYDDRGIGTFLFLVSLVWNIVAFPFWFATEALFSLNEGHAVPGHGILSIAIVMPLLLILDFVWRRYSSPEE